MKRKKQRRAPDKRCVICSAAFRPNRRQMTCSDDCSNARNLEMTRAGKRRRRKANPEKVRAAARDYRERTIEHVREYDAEWKRHHRETHPGEEAAYALQRLAANRERINARRRERYRQKREAQPC